MSELKAYTFSAMERTGLADYYLKSEADKVIAEKDAKILALDAEVAKQKHHAKLFFDERNYAETQLSHSNHKRCLDEAKICQLRLEHYEQYLAGCIHESGPTVRRCEFLVNHYEKWYKCWLALAEEPTWAKFLQLIHKEAK